MKRPLLSVCLLTYNHEKYIRQAIDSILAQEVDFTWQLIIADDCSTDGTQNILREYKQQYPERIHLILQKENVGPEENWLDLISYPKSKYLLYAEGDDYFTDTHKLQAQVDFLEAHPDFALCFHPVKVVYQDGSKPEGIFPTPAERFNKQVLRMDDLLLGNFIQTNSVVYRWQFNEVNIKDVFPRGISPGDWYLHLLHAQTGKIGFIDKAMSVYRRHSAGIWWESDRHVERIWRKYGAAHILLYTEMLKFKGSRAARASIERRIQFVFHALSAIDRRKDEGLVRAAVERVPAAAALFIKNESAALQTAQEEQQELIRQLQAIQPVLLETERQLQEHQIQLHGIKASRVWKLRNKLAKVLGKRQV